MAYDPRTWKNKPDHSSPINAAGLNHMEQGIAEAHELIDGLENANLEINENIWMGESKSYTGENWADIPFTNWGAIRYSDGVLLSNVNAKVSGFIKVFPGDTITFDIDSANTNYAKIAAYGADDYSTYNQDASVSGSSTATTYVVPDGVNYIIITRKRANDDSITIKIYTSLKEDYESFKASMPELLDEKADKSEITDVYTAISDDEKLRNEKLYSNNGSNLFDLFYHSNTNRTGNLFYIKSATPNYYPYADLYTNYPGISLKDLYVSIKAKSGDITLQVAVAANQYGSPAAQTYNAVFENGYYNTIIPANVISSTNKFVVLKITNKRSYDISIEKPYIRISEELKVGKSYKSAYLSVNGNDANSGDEDAPFATVNRALDSGATNIFIAAGNYYQQIDLGKSENGLVRLLNVTPGGRVKFYDPNCLIATEETQESGFTKVYKVRATKNINKGSSIQPRFPENNIWIFQDMVEDESTEVLSSEIHSLQRGKQYRCEDTKIVKCDANTLEDALNEIEESAVYKFYYDSTNEMLYFSRPIALSASNPLCQSTWGTLFLNNSRRNTIEAAGIEAKYQSFNLDYTCNSEIADCMASNIYQIGAFAIRAAIGVKLIRCEAVRAFNGTAGDGFNGQSVENTDAFAKNLAIEMIDCWSHDNNDDGYSDHSRSDTIIRGGLFEYNGKSGLTPSYGDHCVCYNVLSRKNWSGFIVTGNPDDEGNCTSLVCYNCIAENNVIEGKAYGSGFVTTSGTNVLATLINCKSIGHVMDGTNRGYGFLAINGKMELIDCSVADNSHDAGGAGTLTIKNTNIVSN